MPSGTTQSAEEVKRWRSEFTLPAYGLYLNHAAVSPLPFRVLSAVDRAMREAAPGSDPIWLERNAECDRVRESAAKLMEARHAHEIAFVPNTSTGISYVAEGLSWRDGDNVVSAESEFPSNVYPWLGLADRGVEVRRVAEVSGRVPIEGIARAMTSHTRVVALSSVQYASGFRIDLGAVAELCRAHDALLVVDAIQSLGALPLSVEGTGIDVCVAGSHKWLMAGEGIGLFYISPRALERVRPVIRGWLSVKDWFGPACDPPDYADGAARFECGTSNVAGIYGLGAAMDWLLEIGPERTAARVLELARRLEFGLARLGFEFATERSVGTESGIVACALEGVSSADLCEKLGKRDIQVAERRGWLRISPHFYNTNEDIERCLAGIAELV